MHKFKELELILRIKKQLKYKINGICVYINK